MTSASPSPMRDFRPRILEKRTRLKAAAKTVTAQYLDDLLAEIDAALERIDNGSYGICETCRDPIETDRLEHNPLVRFCVDHLNPEQRRAHEQDLALATEIQSRLLPARDIASGRWGTHFRYRPAGIVGGDYCEIVPSPDGGSLFFALGDVTGKGVAASLLMTHLSAIVRSLLSLGLPLAEVMVRANRLFCESTPVTHYATLVAGRTDGDSLEVCNAGHCTPLIFRRDGIERIESTGLPLGLFCESQFAVRRIALHPGENLVLYSDGITEAQDPEGNVYGEDRLIGALRGQPGRQAGALTEGVLSDVARFCHGAPYQDDMTLLFLWRQH